MEGKLLVDGIQYKFGFNCGIPVHQPVKSYYNESVPPSDNVFGLKQLTVSKEKGKAYCVENGDSVNCMPLTTYPHEGPQWENTMHLLNLSKTDTTGWSWQSHFGYFPSVLLTVDVDCSSNVSDSYPDKQNHPNDKIASLESLKNSLRKIGFNPDDHTISEFMTALLVRFSYQGIKLLYCVHSHVSIATVF
eukprot:TRINITY_DN1824_c0_g1_i2.p1 TRINITY_DN1824_c0_g1~~TRINITY_DN1824_c0_g1_i2.p1  ORF type:complete len:190 (+),score=15.24 TRINITY_DN1824_c0_g1_i2:6-575(+)